jgi:predicted nucleic acid-binding protein
VWVDQLRRLGRLDVQTVQGAVAVTCLPVIQEVLQGVPDRLYDLIYEQLVDMEIIELPMGLAVFQQAANYYREARMAGYTIKSPNDCLIAACAIRNNVRLLHRDGDFDALAKVVPKLDALNLTRASAA